MGIYLPNMEMPTSCPCELLGIGYDLYCSFAGGIPARVKEYYECCQNGTRPSWCPLVLVPPHGRCIDADKLVRENYGQYGAIDALALEAIKAAPTILESEEGET